jgi:serine/threonine-protein kinase Chk2
MLQDLSTNGTLVNGSLVGFGQLKDLEESDTITICGRVSFAFKATVQHHPGPSFEAKYSKDGLIEKGVLCHVFACREKKSGQEFAASILQSEAMLKTSLILMGIRHPHVVGLREVFETRGETIYILELAPKGDLFGYIVSKQELSENETRRIFLQLLDAVKYLASPNMQSGLACGGYVCRPC